MAMTIGDQTAASGMTKDVYDEIRNILEPGLSDLSEDDLEPIREGWRNLAFAVSTGVINHIVNNMEIHDVQTRGSVSATVNGNTGAALPANHSHAVNLTGSASNVNFSQSNNGTGLVR